MRTVDGVLHELDVLVLATGFHADAFMRPMAVDGPRRRDARRAVDAAAERVPVDLDARLPELLHAERPQRAGRQLLAHRGRRAAVRLHHAARRRCCATAGPARSRPRPRAMEEHEAARVAAAQNTIWVTGCAAGTSTTAASRRRGRGRSTASARSMAAPDLDCFELVERQPTDAGRAPGAAERDAPGASRAAIAPVVAVLRGVEPHDGVDAWRAGVDRTPDVVGEPRGRAAGSSPVGGGLGDHHAACGRRTSTSDRAEQRCERRRPGRQRS